MERRKNRTVAYRPKLKHRLVLAISGRGRRPGDYVCSCAARFTSVHDFETHRAEKRRAKASA